MISTKIVSNSAARVLPKKSASLRELLVAIRKLKHPYIIDTKVQGVAVEIKNVIDRRSWDMAKKIYNGNSHHIVLIKNPKSKDVTLKQVLNFIQSNDLVQNNINSRTNSVGKKYKSGSFMCGDFAMQLHNDAEIVGIHCGKVIISYRNRKIGHAINIFNSTDYGIIFYDAVHDMLMSEYNFFNQGKELHNDYITKKFPIVDLPNFRKHFYAGIKNVTILW